jgi:hypothetical protein
VADRWCALNQARKSPADEKVRSRSSAVVTAARIRDKSESESGQEMAPGRVTMGPAHDAADACTEPRHSREGLDFQPGRSIRQTGQCRVPRRCQILSTSAAIEREPSSGILHSRAPCSHGSVAVGRANSVVSRWFCWLLRVPRVATRYLRFPFRSRLPSRCRDRYAPAPGRRSQPCRPAPRSRPVLRFRYARQPRAPRSPSACPSRLTPRGRALP